MEKEYNDKIQEFMDATIRALKDMHTYSCKVDDRLTAAGIELTKGCMGMNDKINNEMKSNILLERRVKRLEMELKQMRDEKKGSHGI